MIHSYEFTIHCLTTQQFFTEPSTVRDRYLTQEIIVEGSGEAMNRFKKQIQEMIPLWVKGDRIEFINTLAKFLDLDNKAITEEGEKKFALLDELPDETPDIFFSMALSIPLTHFRQKQLENLNNKLKEASSLPDEIYKKRYIKLIEFMDPDFSILHNLYVLEKISKITNISIDPDPCNRLFTLVLEKLITDNIFPQEETQAGSEN
ncbi:MAG: hypothetical protein ACFFCQ_01890 [Promethearchaeota archaeon]